MKNKNTPNFAKASLGTQKGFSTLLGLLLFIVLVGGGLYLYTEKTSKEMPEIDLVSTTTQKENVKENIVNDKGSFDSQEEQTQTREKTNGVYDYKEEKGILFVLEKGYPNPDQYKLPINITGYLSENGKWRIFEGEAGTIEVYGFVNELEKKIATSPITLNDEGYFDLMVGDRQWVSSLDNKNGFVLFKEAGVKDTDEIDFIKVPILFDIPKT